MYFYIDTKSSVPLYEQIVYQVKDMNTRGLVNPGEKMPSIRELSSQMVINPNTVSKAYQELERLGLIVTIRGKGTFIAEVTENIVSAKEKKKLHDAVRQAVIDCRYAGIAEEEVRKWVLRCYSDKEGDHHGSKTHL